MDDDLFLWFLCGCYLLGGMSIGYWFSQWRNKRGHKTGTGRWDWSNRRFVGGDDEPDFSKGDFSEKKW